jgi:hypothetical protein
VENDSSARKQACVVYVSEYLEKQIGRRFYLFRAKISLFGFEFWHGSSRRRIKEHFVVHYCCKISNITSAFFHDF